MPQPEFEPAQSVMIGGITVCCPCCGSSLEFEELQIDEDIGGPFKVSGENRFQECEECGQLYDAGAVTFSPNT